MTTYVIKRDDGKYAARFGGEHSYTTKLQNAQPFDTREDAQHHCCGNEAVTTITAEMEAA